METPALEAIEIPGARAPAAGSGHGVVGTFAEKMRAVLAQADALQKDADREVQGLAQGSGATVDTMVALSKADLSLRLVVAIRNRALEAYQELMRMQV